MMRRRWKAIRSKELTAPASERVEKSDALLASIKADEARLQEIAVPKTHIINYAKCLYRKR